MGLALLDRPELLQTLFFPRPAVKQFNGEQNVWDGTIAVDGAELGYRLYVNDTTSPLVVFFHGNGEIASDYNSISAAFAQIGTSLLVIDFRGYGWSTGQPTATTLLGDVPACFEALPAIQAKAGLAAPPLYIMGRSMGSAPAIELAASYPHAFKGLILESGFASILPLLLRRGFDASVFGGEPDPVGNERKVGELDLPLLVIHGENDQLISVNEGQKLYDASKHTDKRILRMRGVGHNDLLLRMDVYFNAVAAFINDTKG